MLDSSSTTRTRLRPSRACGRSATAADGGRSPRGRWVSSQASMSRLRNRHCRPDPDRRDLSGLDQPVNRAKVDLEVLQDFFGRQEDFVVWKVHAH